MRMGLLLFVSVSAFGQSGDPRVQRLTEDYVKQHPIFAPKPKPATQPAVPAIAPAKPCSVPLIEMQIRKGVEYTMRQLAPPKEPIDAMPQAIVPAPPCPR